MADSSDSDDEAPHVPTALVTRADHLTTLDLTGTETIDDLLTCAVCLGILVAPTATECLHRFCSACIETSMRIGKKECPTCRFPIPTRRALRRDENFDGLLRCLYPDGIPEDDEEVDVRQYAFVAPANVAAAPPAEAGRRRHRKTECEAPAAPAPAPAPAPVPVAAPEAAAVSAPLPARARAAPVAGERTWVAPSASVLTWGSLGFGLGARDRVKDRVGRRVGARGGGAVRIQVRAGGLGRIRVLGSG